MIKKIITEFIIICTFSFFCFSQTNNNLMKYWYYRNRLQYFHVPGEKHGESQIICVRNIINASNDPTDQQNGYPAKNVDYGQHGKYTGMYVGVLATEYYLLYKNAQFYDASKTYQELFMALNAIKNYWDEKAETFWPNYQNTNPNYNPDYPDTFNGFFIRGSVPCDFFSNDPGNPNGYNESGISHLKLLNKGLTQNDTWHGVESVEDIYSFGNSENGYLPRGHPGYADHRTADYCEGQAVLSEIPLYEYDHTEEGVLTHPHDFHPESMSQDEAIWILLGCELTIKLCPGSVASQLANEMKQKIADYLINVHHIFGLAPNRLYEPDGFLLGGWEGGNTYAFGRPLAAIAKRIQFSDVPQWILWAVLSVIPIKDFDLVGCLAATSNSWKRTGLGIINATSKNDCETFYVLLWEVLYHTILAPHNQQIITEKALTQLNAAPCEGPYCYAMDFWSNSSGHPYLVKNGFYSPNGWAGTYKWCSDKYKQNYGSEYYGNYNGTDYMLLYNLFHIVNNDSCPYYVNYVDRSFSGYLPIKISNLFNFEYATNTYPLKLAALDTLTSSQVIGIQTQPDVTINPGNVTYVAGTSIHLRPGFQATEGCYFHAYISDLHCDEFLCVSKGNPVLYTPYFDSLISAPKTPYDLEVEDTTGDNNLLTLECPIDTLKFKGINGDTIDELYTYYWDFGNGITSTEVAPEVFYQPGTYNFTLILTDTNGVADTMKIVLEVPDCGTQTGTQDQATSSSLSNGTIRIVPNPNNGEMWLLSKITYEDECRLVIYDITGREVYTKLFTVISGKTQITASELLNGVYLYSVFSENGTLIAKDKLVIINK